VEGDILVDCSVNIYDLIKIAGHFGQISTHQEWDPAVDVVQNDEIDIYDVTFVASRFTS
jgi:hypothetical protein